MSETLLQQILSELKALNQRVGNIENEQQAMKSEMQTMKVQLDENTEIVKAIRDRQEEIDAKIDTLTLDVHKIHELT